uniref:Methyl-CpG-binding domain-containing protein 6 n=1 Tax=Noccaea caerulescens TaxID=107243 RepID=A0A1J3CXG0_NOCCA
MSTSSPSDNATQPGSVPGDFPPDPLLSTGSFISSTTNAGDGALDSSAKRRPVKEGSGVIGSGESVRFGMSSNGKDQAQAESKSRKRAAPGDNWLPPGWTVEDKVRTSGATAGSVDKYYHEPVTGRKFRSRTEVLYYLEHGTAKKGSKNSDHFDGQGSSNKASRKAREPPPPPPPPLNFDFENPPEKVSWSMANAGEEAWTPFIGDDKVQDSVRRDWCSAFTAVTTQNPSKLSS